jgi:2-polyprenyl-6-methoxyphenol hydroxylase-like FAD-dependent oxidoreductase
MSSVLPVLIVGAGPTGLALAVQLQRCGTPFRIIDPKPEVKNESRAFGVHVRTIEIFRQLGVLDRIQENSKSLNFNMNIRYLGKKIATIKIPDSSYPDPKPILIPQYYTEVYLREHLISLGIEVEQLELDSFEQKSDRVFATLRSPNEEISQVECHYMVGCDGAHSVVRKKLGLDFPGTVRDRQWALIDLEMETDLHPTDGSVIWSKKENLFCVPFDNFYRCIVDYGSPEDEVEVTEEKVINKIMELVKPNVIKPTKVLWLSKFKISERMVPINYQGRVLLCGDAAHIHSPAGGFGMNTGIQDAYHLGWMISLMSRGIVDEAKFKNIFWEERKLVWTKVLNVAGGTTNTLISQATFFVDFFRRFILPSLLKFSFLQRIVSSTGAGEYIKFPTSILTHRNSLKWIPGNTSAVGERFKILPLRKVGETNQVQVQDILSGRYTFDVLVYVKDLIKSQSNVLKLMVFLNDSDNIVNKLRSNNHLAYPLISIKIITPKADVLNQDSERHPLQFLDKEQVYEDSEFRMRDLLPIDLAFSNAALIVRPDGYIGKVCSITELSEISDYFEHIFH